jgi:hypothetical protein
MGRILSSNVSSEKIFLFFSLFGKSIPHLVRLSDLRRMTHCWRIGFPRSLCIHIHAQFVHKLAIRQQNQLLLKGQNLFCCFHMAVCQVGVLFQKLVLLPYSA